jgi:subtilase family serine protease
MMHFRTGFVGVCATTATACTLAVTPALASASPPTVKLRNSVSRAATRAPRTGAVAGNSQIAFQVNLKLPDQQAAEKFATSVSTPGSASYGKYLTAAQWESRFSPSTSSVQAVERFLRQSGFKVAAASADRMEVSASGTATQVEQAFSTSLAMYRVQGHTLRLANRAFAVPSSLASIVQGVSGIDQTLSHPNSTTGASAASSTPQASGENIPQPAGFRVAPPCGAFYNQQIDSVLPPFGQGYPANPPWAVCGYTPSQFRSAYGLTGADTGAGETVAIVDAYQSPTLFSDAHTFAALNDPSNPLNSSQFSELPTNGFNQVNACDASDWFGEQTLDVEAVHATAPGANILYAGAKNCANGLVKTLRTLVDGHLADVITNSYGTDAGDFLESDADRAPTDNILLMAAATGITVTFSSGDDGDEFTTEGVTSPDYPASSPFATAVGGTTLQVAKNGSRLGEYGWSTARSFLCNAALIGAGGCKKKQLEQWLPIDLALDGGSGGGTSYAYTQPTYQAGVVPTKLSELRGSTPMRVVPDISMDADPATGMLVGETQTFPNGVFYDQYRIGGTSVASPLFAGIVARVDQTLGRPLGFLNPTMYSLAGKANAIFDVGPAGKQDQSRADFVNEIDNTDGTEFTTRIIDYEGPEQFCSSATDCTTQNVALNTTAGYDNMTGLGAPNSGFVNQMVKAAGR